MGSVLRPGVLLRLEGGAALAAALVLYAHYNGSWLVFALLILAPDLGALGYLAGVPLGAALYNAVHNYVLPLALAAFGLFGHNPLALQLALIWIAHIGGDRLLGFGLKYPTDFKDTHLNRV